MSLFGTIQQSSGALQLAQLGLQVVGNNLANANTPGYVRQSLQQVSAPGIRNGPLIQGQGVRALGIVQVVDAALTERMFRSESALATSDALRKATGELEQLVSDLDQTGLNQQLSRFNNTLHELSAQPSDSALRDFVIFQGDSLARQFRHMRHQAVEGQQRWSRELEGIAREINRLTERIAKANVDIATLEDGGLSHSQATGLRDQRLQDIATLSKYVSLTVREQENGAVTLFVEGDYLVSQGLHRRVGLEASHGGSSTNIQFIDTASPLQASEGLLPSTIMARDQVFGEFIKRLDSIAANLIRAINVVHSQGKGRRSFDSIVSDASLAAGTPIAESGLPWAPQDGSFEIQLVDRDGKLVSNHRIPVLVSGPSGDSTVQSIVEQIDLIDGIQATIRDDGRIEISSQTPGFGFTFGADTSGFLASAGINTFFAGNDASDIDIHELLKGDSDYLAVSAQGIGQDTDVLAQMVDRIYQPLDELSGGSVQGMYESVTGSVAQDASRYVAESEGLRSFHELLRSEHLAVTGVNIDEESIRMLTYQRSFQASSRVIATAVEMLEMLVNL